MKGSVKKLKELVNDINGKFTSTGGELVESLNDLSNIQTERDHAKRLLESAIACKELSGLLLEVRTCLEKEQHYQAMRIIQRIQSEQSNPIVRPIARHLQTWLPIAKNKLLYAARSEADVFVQNLREKMALIGSTLLIRQSRASLQYYHTSVMNATLSEGGFEGGFMRRELTISQSVRDHAQSMSVFGRASIALGYILLNAASFRLSLHIGKSFFPETYIPVHFTLPHNKEGADVVDYQMGEIAALHKALHIYHELGIVNNFYDHYRHDRKETFSKIIKAFERNANSMGLMRAVPKYFDELTGFFAIECIMGNMIVSNSDLFDKRDLEIFWLEAMTKLRDVTLLMGITLTSPAELLQLKEEMLLLLHMMADEMIGLDMGVLLAVMWTLFDSFDALSVQFFTVQIRDALDQSSFQRYVVTSPEVYQLQIKHFRLDMIDVNQDSILYQAKMGLKAAGGGGRSMQTNNNNVNHSNSNASVNGFVNSNNSNGSSSSNVTANEVHMGRSMMDLDAHLDALEEEMGLGSTTNTTNSNNNTNSLSGSSAGNMASSSQPQQSIGGSSLPMMLHEDVLLQQPANKFMMQTYPFSAFVPVIMTELQLALTRLFLFVMIPAPEVWSRQRRQQEKSARLIGSATAHNNGNNITNNSTTNNNNNNSSGVDVHNSRHRQSPVGMLLSQGGGSGSGGGRSYNNNNNNRSSSPHQQQQSSSSSAAAGIGASGNTSSTNNNNNNNIGNVMLNLATHAGANINVTDFLGRNVLGLFALLCDQLQLCLQKDGLETALSKACQIAIDTTYIALSTEFYFSLLETNIEIIFGVDAYDPSLLTQTQDVVLQRIRRVSAQAEDLIFELLATKIEALLESLQFIDYCPDYPPAQVYPPNSSSAASASSANNNNNNNSNAPISFMVNLGAANTAWVHDSIDSLVDYLTITFMCLTHLPHAVREAVHFTSCAKLAQGILEFLLSDRVRALNIYALVALDADVKKLMLFADSCGIPDLRKCFDELHAMVRACLHPDLQLLGEDAGFRMQLFPQVSAEKLAILLEKVQASPVSASASNLPGLEKHMTRSTARRLRQPPVSNSSNSGHGNGSRAKSMDFSMRRSTSTAGGGLNTNNNGETMGSQPAQQQPANKRLSLHKLPPGKK